MGVWDKLKASVSRKPERNGTGLEVSRWNRAPPRRGSRELLEAYASMPSLQLVVGTVADAVANVEWRAYERKSKSGKVKDFSLRVASHQSRAVRLRALIDTGEAEEAPDHPVIKLLSDPNDHFTGPQFIKLIETHLCLLGEAFIALELVGGIPVSLWPIPPHQVLQLPDTSAPKDERTYTIQVGNKSGTIPASSIIHIRELDPANPLGRGVGAGFVLGDELDTDEYAARFVKNAFFNNMLPASVIALEGATLGAKDPSALALKEAFSREHKGADNAGKTAITNGKMTFARLDTPFKDMQLVQLREFLRDAVRMAFRVPPEVIGDMSSSNKATAFAAREVFAEQAVKPRMEFLRAAFQKWLVPLVGDDVVLHFDSPTPADAEMSFRVMATVPSAFTYNEWRATAGLKPHPERQGFPAPMPGSNPEEPKQPPTPEEGGAAEADAEHDQDKAGVSDPPWAGAPLR